VKLKKIRCILFLLLLNFMKNIIKYIQKGYDLISEHFSSTRKYAWKEFVFFKPFLRNKMDILDLGCGNGRLIDFLDEYLNTYLGVDLSEGMLKEASKRYPNMEFRQGEMSNIKNIVNSYYDAIFSIAAFHHLPTRKLRKKAVLSFKDILKNNGIICMTVWNLWQKRYFWNYIESYLCLRPRFIRIPWKDKDGNIQANRYYYSFRKAEILRLFKSFGFDVEFVEYVSCFCKNMI